MNKSDLEKMQKIEEEYEKYLKESPIHSVMYEIAEDIRKRKDMDMAMEFTRTIGELLRENGITVYCQEYEKIEDSSNKKIEVKYGVTFDRIDCTEHDRKFTEKIEKLERECKEKQKEIDRLLKDKKSIDDNLLKNSKDIYNITRENNEMKKKISELESELSVKENLLKIKEGLYDGAIPKEITIDGFKCNAIQQEQGLYIGRDMVYEIIDKEKEPLKKEIERKESVINQIDNVFKELFGVNFEICETSEDFEGFKKCLEKNIREKLFGEFIPTEPIKVADMLINAESERETNSFERAFGAGEKDRYNIFSVSELRQIAEHLLVYCNHNSEE